MNGHASDPPCPHPRRLGPGWVQAGLVCHLSLRGRATDHSHGGHLPLRGKARACCPFGIFIFGFSGFFRIFRIFFVAETAPERSADFLQDLPEGFQVATGFFSESQEGVAATGIVAKGTSKVAPPHLVAPGKPAATRWGSGTPPWPVARGG